MKTPSPVTRTESLAHLQSVTNIFMSPFLPEINMYRGFSRPLHVKGLAIIGINIKYHILTLMDNLKGKIQRILNKFPLWNSFDLYNISISYSDTQRNFETNFVLVTNIKYVQKS